jgi:hypothetical protein
VDDVERGESEYDPGEDWTDVYENNENHMKSIIKAHQYLKITSSKDVFIRVVPYLVFSESGFNDHNFIKKTTLNISGSF